jgi:hypothetical protein
VSHPSGYGGDDLLAGGLGRDGAGILVLIRTFDSWRSDDGRAVIASSWLEDAVPFAPLRGGQAMRRLVQAALVSSALVFTPVACGAGNDVSEPSVSSATSSSATSSSASTTVTGTVPISTTSLVIPRTTVTFLVEKGAPCSGDVLAALLDEARRWAATNAASGTLITAISSARCGGGFAVGSMRCETTNDPNAACQGTAVIFQLTSGVWTLIREGDVDCSSDPDPAVRAACAAVGRTT